MKKSLLIQLMVVLGIYFPLLGLAQGKSHFDTVVTSLSGKYDLGAMQANGSVILTNYSGKPDKNGILGSYELTLPAFNKGSYFTGDQPATWPAFANRVLPYSFKTSLKGLNYGGSFIIMELEEGGYLAITPLTGQLTAAWFNISKENTLLLNFGNLGTNPVSGDLPLFAWSRSTDVYTACREAWREAIDSAPIKGSTTFRESKTYPEVFKYLGWCSWEEYKFDISEKLLSNAVKQLENSGLPFRYMLVDDGHLIEKDQKLVSFEPNSKFPGGWKPLLSLRTEDKIKWMGLWHGFNGYWGTISRDNTFSAALKKELAPILKTGALLPRNNPESSRAFYESYMGSVKKGGFDFVKIDIQASNLAWYRGSDNAVQAAGNNSKALEEVVNRELGGMINCMAQGPVNLFNTKYSAITRCSIDYGAGDEKMGKSHIQQSYSNMLWLGHTVWGDHDMFHSSDSASGELMAISKAMSGGPIYLSDPVAKLVPRFIRPLCYSDGRLLRPLAPAMPLPESIFVDALNEAAPYRVIAPLSGGAAAVVVYNLQHPSGKTPLRSTVVPADYIHASGLMQPYPGKWNIPAEGLIVYDWHQKKAERLVKEYAFDLNGYANKLLHLCPIRNNWALIGLTDKYLSPAGAEIVTVSSNELKIRLREAGPFSIWSGNGKPKSAGITFASAGNGLYSANLAVGKGSRIITISR